MIFTHFDVELNGVKIPDIYIYTYYMLSTHFMCRLFFFFSLSYSFYLAARLPKTRYLSLLWPILAAAAA